MKTCTRCNIDKPINEFYKRSDTLGVRSHCKKCTTNSTKLYQKCEKYQIYEQSRLASKREYMKEHMQKAEVKKARNIYANKYRKHRMKTDINFRLSVLLRCRMGVAIRKKFKKGSAVKDLGCSIEELKKYLKNQFYPNPNTGVAMTWDNWGKGYNKWQIDHIHELRHLNLENRKEFLKAVHYSNLQPLWQKDHVMKTANPQVSTCHRKS